MTGASANDKPRAPSDGPSRRSVLGWAASATLWGTMAEPPQQDGQTPIDVERISAAEEPSRGNPRKQRASSDYRASLSAHGGQLSNDHQSLIEMASRAPDEQFAVAIIGSGYGAAICAARLSGRLSAGQRICILERGREWLPGTFPDTFRTAARQSRQKLTGRGQGSVNNPLGLYHITMNSEVNTLSGSGLGGTSLINANVALKPDQDVFRQECWPAALRERAVLDPYFERAARMLGLARTPADQTGKVLSRRDAAERLNPRPGFFDLSPLAVTYDARYLDGEGKNPHGMIQRPCTLCGDCITGCNVGAKNTLVTNYLPLAKARGTEMYTQVEVVSIRAGEGVYHLQVVLRDDSAGDMREIPLTISSRLVVLAAGSPGSAEILLQSRACGLEASPALGQRWSFNGDTIGFVIRPRHNAPIGGVGTNADGLQRVGPTVQTSLNYNRRPDLRHRLLVQEAAIPHAVKNIFSLLLQDRDLDHSMIMLGMGHDGAQGRLIWKENRWQIDWPDLRDSHYRKMVFHDFSELAEAHGGWYKRLRMFGDTLVSVHPLGGCGMSDDPYSGVVNDRGQVFDWRRGAATDTAGLPAVYPGLYVADGSVMPTSLGVNPLMTICAVSERIAEQIVGDPQWADLFAGGVSRG